MTSRAVVRVRVGSGHGYRNQSRPVVPASASSCLVILMGGDLHMFVSEHAVHRHFRRLVRRHADPLSALLDLPRPAARRQIRLHDAPHDASASWSTNSPASPKSPASRARSGLEKVEIEDPFLAKGIRFVADGYDTNFIRDNLERDRDNFLTHLDEGQKIYRAVGDCAPAFGMIGTLIGMVQMFANMTDPSKLGPFMAGALLATFYGAALANLFCLPIADKLHLKLVDEEINRTLIIDGILMIREAKSPTLGARNAARLSAREASPQRSRGRRRGRRRSPPKRGASGVSDMARRKEAHGGGHGWFVTFADLMGLLVSFFVMLVAFSTQDQAEAASRRRLDARRLRRAGPACAIPASSRCSACRRGRSSRTPPTSIRRKPRRRRRPTSTTSSATTARASRTTSNFALAAASLRQALAGHAGNHRSLQAHHGRGDQAGPQYRDRRSGRPLDVPGRLQGALRAHAQADPEDRAGAQGDAVPHLDHRPHRGQQGAAEAGLWRRGNFPPTAPMRCAQILAAEGLPSGHIFMVAGKADTEPLFPDNPVMSPNRRVTITLMREEPPLPADFKP